VIESRRMGWAEYVEDVEENTYFIWNSQWDPGLYFRTLLKWIVKNRDMRVLTVFAWLGYGPVTGLVNTITNLGLYKTR
jgi:hypothetical protein